MTLNPDCIRDILLYFEEAIVDQGAEFPADNSYLNKYEPAVLEYHFKQCEQNGLFYGVNTYMRQEHSVEALTPKAHDLIAKIRDDKVWKKVIAYLAKAATIALPAISEAAVAIWQQQNQSS